jgi:hypothetical protein
MHSLWVVKLQNDEASHFDLFPVLVQVCSCLEFDLTIGLIPRDYVASSCSHYFSKLYIVYLAISKLIET